MEEAAIVRNFGNGVGSTYLVDPQVINSLGLGHLLVQIWTKSSDVKIDGEGDYCEVTNDPNGYQIIGCDEDETTLLLCYRSRFAGSTIRSYSEGVIARVFRKECPEMSPNISYYSQQEYPHRDFALSCGILSSFCLPFRFRSPGTYRYGVLEIVSTHNQDLATLRKFCESFDGFDWFYSFSDIDDDPEDAIPEIDQFLEVVCQKFHLPLAQYCCGPHDQHSLFVHQFSYKDIQTLAPPWCQFKDACLHKCLKEGEGTLGNSFNLHAAIFYRDIAALSIIKYPFAHYARNCGSVDCLAMYLSNSSKPCSADWILEFFLPTQDIDNNYHQNFLSSLWTTIKECLPNYRLGTGEKLGQGFLVYVINFINVVQPYGSLPHQKGSEHTRSMNLFKVVTEPRRNSNSYEKTATGETSEITPQEASQPKLFEEYFNAMVSERVDELEESPIKCIELQSLTSQVRRSEETFRDEGYTGAFDKVDKVVEVLPDDDMKYAATPASKRLKKSKIPCTVENISKQFGRPLKDAAESFGVSVSTFKRRCRDVGISWWQPGTSKIIDGQPGEKNFSSGMLKLPNRPVVTHASQELNTMTVKVTYNTDNIRFELPSSSGIAELENCVIERLHLDRKSFSLKYQDDEGDWILIACDKDVRECMKISRSLKKTTINMLLGLPLNNYAP